MLARREASAASATTCQCHSPENQRAEGGARSARQGAAKRQYVFGAHPDALATRDAVMVFDAERRHGASPVEHQCLRRADVDAGTASGAPGLAEGPRCRCFWCRGEELPASSQGGMLGVVPSRRRRRSAVRLVVEGLGAVVPATPKEASAAHGSRVTVPVPLAVMMLAQVRPFRGRPCGRLSEIGVYAGRGSLQRSHLPVGGDLAGERHSPRHDRFCGGSGAEGAAVAGASNEVQSPAGLEPGGRSSEDLLIQSGHAGHGPRPGQVFGGGVLVGRGHAASDFEARAGGVCRVDEQSRVDAGAAHGTGGARRHAQPAGDARVGLHRGGLVQVRVGHDRAHGARLHAGVTARPVTPRAGSGVDGRHGSQAVGRLQQPKDAAESGFTHSDATFSSSTQVSCWAAPPPIGSVSPPPPRPLSSSSREFTAKPSARLPA